MDSVMSRRRLTRAKRTDVVVDYIGEPIIVELKIWHGNEYHQWGKYVYGISD